MRRMLGFLTSAAKVARPGIAIAYRQNALAGNPLAPGGSGLRAALAPGPYRPPGAMGVGGAKPKSTYQQLMAAGRYDEATALFTGKYGTARQLHPFYGTQWALKNLTPKATAPAALTYTPQPTLPVSGGGQGYGSTGYPNYGGGGGYSRGSAPSPDWYSNMIYWRW